MGKEPRRVRNKGVRERNLQRGVFIGQMSSQYYQQRINAIDREIVNLERQVAEQAKTESRCQQAIADLECSLRNCPPAFLQSKMGQIDTQRRTMQRAIDRRASLSSQIARKRDERANMSLSLQREVAHETKRQQQAQANLMQNYESRIAELSAALSRSTRIPAPAHNLYADTNANPEQYDVFISHASEDKDSFVNEFADELKKRGVKVWIDDISIRWGDSLRTKIDHGLKSSKFGIVVISRHYIRKGWTNYELDGLFEKEMTGGKTILPIWHDISKKEVQDFSPSLAGRKAMTTGNMTAAEIADELASLLPDRDSPPQDTCDQENSLDCPADGKDAGDGVERSS